MFEPNDQGLIVGQNLMMLGHEAPGFVVQAGSATTGFRPGDKVGFLAAVDCCFECVLCTKNTNIGCVTGTQKIRGFSCDAYFEKYAVVDTRGAMILPEELDVFDRAALVLRRSECFPRCR